MLVEDDWFIQDMRQWMINNPHVADIASSEKISYNKGNKNPFYGKTHSLEWRNRQKSRMLGNKITLGMKCKPEHVRQRAEKNKRPVLINGMFYPSGMEAARALGVSNALIVKWTKIGKATYADMKVS